MRRENFSEQKKNGSFVVAVLQLIMIITLLIVLIVSIVLTSSCSGLTIIDNGDSSTKESEKENQNEGTLLVSFTKEHKTKAYSRDMPDSNLFTLSIKRVDGQVFYEGLYSQRPNELKLAAGNYDLEVYSRDFSVPEFDAPLYYDSGSVVVEEGKTTSISFLCRQSNGAMRLGFTAEFKKRFTGYVPEIEDAKGKADYSYFESRFLYLNPGDVFIRLRSISSSGGSGSSGGSSSSGEESGSFLITRKSIAAMEMVTVNLHSSVADGGGGGDIPPGNSQVFTGILIDTSSVWISENVIVGERNDGSIKELALTVDEIAGYVGAKGVWVSGYVVGYLTQASLISSGPFETETNVAIASAPSEKNREFCAGVALTAGGVRAALNLKSNPGVLGKKVFIKGTIAESYFGLKGVNSVTEYFIE